MIKEIGKATRVQVPNGEGNTKKKCRVRNWVGRITNGQKNEKA